MGCVFKEDVSIEVAITVHTTRATSTVDTTISV